MSGFSLQDRVKALNLGLTIDSDFDTGRVTVTGGSQTFAFESREQAGQALDLANYVVFNTLYKMSVGDGPVASLLAKLPRHAASCSNQNVLDALGAYKDVEACGCAGKTLLSTAVTAVSTQPVDKAPDSAGSGPEAVDNPASDTDVESGGDTSTVNALNDLAQRNPLIHMGKP